MIIKYKIIYLIVLINFLQNVYSTVDFYNLNELLPLNLDGWCNPANRIHLKRITLEKQPKIVVELGVWMGLSISIIAQNMLSNSKLYAVDTFKGSNEHITDPQYSQFLPTLYQQFLSNMIHLKITDKVIPVKMTTLEAALFLDIKPEMVYVDASHEEEDVYHDIKAWYAKLSKNGIMCGDDWGWETVQRAVIRIAKELNQTVRFDDSFWWFAPKN